MAIWVKLSLRFSTAQLKPLRLPLHPSVILGVVAGVDDQQKIVLGEPVHDYVVDERSLRIEQRRILRLANHQPRGVVHRHLLDRRERLRPGNAYVAHVADVKDADAVANRHVLGHQPTGLGILDRHIPAVELDHLRAHLPMHAIERRLANGCHLRAESHRNPRIK